MTASLSDLVDNMSGIFISKKCKKYMEGKINSKCHFAGLKSDGLEYVCRECREKWHDSIHVLINTFPSVCQFCNGDLNRFILLLGKGFYPYENMDNLEKFDEITIPP